MNVMVRECHKFVLLVIYCSFDAGNGVSFKWGHIWAVHQARVLLGQERGAYVGPTWFHCFQNFKFEDFEGFDWLLRSRQVTGREREGAAGLNLNSNGHCFCRYSSSFAHQNESSQFPIPTNMFILFHSSSSYKIPS